MNNINKRLIEVRKELHFSTQKDFAQVLEMPFRTLQNYEQGNSVIPHTFLQNLYVKFNVSPNWLLLGLGDIFVDGVPYFLLPSDNVVAEKILDDLIAFFKGKKESLSLSKKIFFSINSNTKKFAYLLDELLEKIDDSQYQKKDIISILDKDLSFFTKITSIVEIKMLKEFIETLDENTLSFMCQNKKAVQLVIKAAFSSMDYAINKAITK